MVSSYLIAKNTVIEELIVNRSRFICYLIPCTSIDILKAFIQQLQQEHPQASHYCYAALFERHDNSQCYVFSDDGEPSGTAGRPMLSALQGNGIGEICAVVVRYFGGTKLGTGGLQRAYGASVKQALSLLESKVKIPMVSRSMACQYTQINDVLHVIEKYKGTVTEQRFLENITLLVQIPQDNIQLIEQQITIISSGSITLCEVFDQN